jgi:pyridoxamine 5'-phosphate oxidase
MNAPRLTVLREVEAAVWRELGACVRDKAHPWRVAVLATAGDDGADARSVVLREWDEAARTLIIYTDARSPKAQQIEAHPLGTLVLWSAMLAWQLRLRVRLGLETAGLRVSSRWARLKMTPAAHDYLSPLPPGSPLVQAVATRESRGHFAVITAEVLAVDWLELHAEGHRRVLIDGEGARWVTP